MLQNKIKENFLSIFYSFENRLTSLEFYLMRINDEEEDYLSFNEDNHFEEDIGKWIETIKIYAKRNSIELDNKTVAEVALSIATEEREEEKIIIHQFICQSFLSLLWSQLEGLLDSLVKFLEREYGSKPFLYNEKLPTLNILLNKINNYGLIININPELGRKIQLIRKFRNKFVHSLGGNIVGEINNQAIKDFEKIKQEGDINLQFCLDSLNTVKLFTERIKESFKKKYKQE